MGKGEGNAEWKKETLKWAVRMDGGFISKNWWHYFEKGQDWVLLPDSPGILAKTPWDAETWPSKKLAENWLEGHEKALASYHPNVVRLTCTELISCE